MTCIWKSFYKMTHCARRDLIYSTDSCGNVCEIDSIQSKVLMDSVLSWWSCKGTGTKNKFYFMSSEWQSVSCLTINWIQLFARYATSCCSFPRHSRIVETTVERSSGGGSRWWKLNDKKKERKCSVIRKRILIRHEYLCHLWGFFFLPLGNESQTTENLEK